MLPRELMAARIEGIPADATLIQAAEKDEATGPNDLGHAGLR